MERVHTIFTCVGLRIVTNGVEVKFTHQDDQVILRVSADTQVALGHQYVLSMKPYIEPTVTS